MKLGKFLLVLSSILLLAAVLVGAGPPPPKCPNISVVKSFSAPETPHGLTFDGKHLYVAGRDNDNPDNIFKIDTTGVVIDSFEVPGNVTGLTYKDGNIWAATDSDLTITEYSPSGDLLQSFDAPGTDSTGLVFQHNVLWNADFNWDEPVAYLHRIKTKKNGEMVVKTYEAPGPGPEGLAFDGVSLWHVDIYTGQLYKLNPATKVWCEYNIGNITDGEGFSPIGLTFDGTYLWLAMQDNAMIYQLDIGE